MFHFCAYLIGYLLPFLRKNHELHRLSFFVHDIVEHEIFDDHGTETEHNHLQPFQVGTKLWDEETAADDDKVDENKDSAQ